MSDNNQESPPKCSATEIDWEREAQLAADSSGYVDRRVVPSDVGTLILERQCYVNGFREGSDFAKRLKLKPESPPTALAIESWKALIKAQSDMLTFYDQHRECGCIEMSDESLRRCDELEGALMEARTKAHKFTSERTKR